MYHQRPSRLPKASKNNPQRSPSPNEEVIQRKLKSKRQRTGPRKIEAGDNIVNTDEGKDRDIIDIINSTHDGKDVEEYEGKSVEVVDEGVDESDEDCCSVSSSVASGPSFLRNASPKKPRPSQGLCSDCQNLYRKAKKIKAPMKSKLLNNDPKSLTCDQWVLIKDWRPKRLPNAKGKLLLHVQLVKKRLKVNNGAKRPAQCVVEGESSACSRPHSFLQRNLRQHVRLLVKKDRKKNKRKRRRNGSQGPRATKQQHLQSNKHSQHISISSTNEIGLHPTSGHSSRPGLEGHSDQEVDDQADTNLNVGLIPPTVTLTTTKPSEVPLKHKTPKKRGGFRDLLVQLRGNSNVIVRESH
ncbi:uncharacterized protein si:ch211-227n13.3 isoform X2 [Etheostoma spectabile]|uniref:Uncharacterized protein n=2 Tax=Etheostoma spectabile TaxID=54343 RepID=A0A5J5D0K5_9PERO|nr:uncharacterized protein LOC116698734 isoform X2 [Etheostoma spectabile]KAA8587447.1 hypothetical protein FQN60_016309 [Etheostoma spectabile]